MKVVIITNLFPNAREPNRAAYHAQQFTALSRRCSLKVVAPLPYFQYSSAHVPSREVVGGIEVFHPRYLVIPRILRFTYGVAFFAGIWQTLKDIEAVFKYDTILAAWAYPDAFGSALAARLLGKKFFVIVVGSDINLAGKFRFRVAMIRWALRRAQGVIAVSRPLREKLIAMGIPEAKITVIPNGIDTAKFYPRDKAPCRERLGLARADRIILYVGNFAPVKGVGHLIRAFSLTAGAPDLKLVLVGDGEEREMLAGLACGLGVQERVVFAGRKAHQEIPAWMSAGDVFCLPSLSEGCPNVLLEALACGMKVVATNVGGVPDIIDTPEKGWLAAPQDPGDLARCLKAALAAPAAPGPVRTMSWEENAGILFKTISGARHEHPLSS